MWTYARCSRRPSSPHMFTHAGRRSPCLVDVPGTLSALAVHLQQCKTLFSLCAAAAHCACCLPAFEVTTRVRTSTCFCDRNFLLSWSLVLAFAKPNIGAFDFLLSVCLPNMDLPEGLLTSPWTAMVRVWRPPMAWGPAANGAVTDSWVVCGSRTGGAGEGRRGSYCCPMSL
jgi:hypothetical protein